MLGFVYSLYLSVCWFKGLFLNMYYSAYFFVYSVLKIDMPAAQIFNALVRCWVDRFQSTGLNPISRLQAYTLARHWLPLHRNIFHDKLFAFCVNGK